MHTPGRCAFQRYRMTSHKIPVNMGQPTISERRLYPYTDSAPDGR